MIADEIGWENRHEFDAGSRVVIAKMYAALVRARNPQMQVKRAAPVRPAFTPAAFLFDLNLLRVHASY